MTGKSSKAGKASQFPASDYENLIEIVSTIAWRCILGIASAHLLERLSYLCPARVGDRFARALVVTI